MDFPIFGWVSSYLVLDPPRIFNGIFHEDIGYYIYIYTIYMEGGSRPIMTHSHMLKPLMFMDLHFFCMNMMNIHTSQLFWYEQKGTCPATSVWIHSHLGRSRNGVVPKNHCSIVFPFRPGPVFFFSRKNWWLRQGLWAAEIKPFNPMRAKKMRKKTRYP